MTNQTMKCLIKKKKEFNIILLLQLQVPSKEHLEVSYTVKKGLNLPILDVGLGNCVPFMK